MKKGGKRILTVLLAVILTLSAALGGMYLYTTGKSVEDLPETMENTTGLIQANGRGLYDAAGNRIQLRGINAGQILLQEGWMSPFALEPKKNEDGSYVKDKDGNLQYPEFTEEEFRRGLAENPNLADYDVEELLKYYYSCFFAEEDFRIIREDLHMNTIRLPFYWRNLLQDDLTRKGEEEAFAYLDWFVGEAAKQGLYVILDLHGAPGSQNGYEHSGSDVPEAKLWTDEAYVNATVDLWAYVAEHYSKTAPELGKWVASYDILNEPTYERDGVTTEECWDVFDRIYDAIRATGDNHVVTMTGCWDFAKLPDPEVYGWENVMYQYHWYNWWHDFLPTEALYMYYDLTDFGRDYDVPVFIGEFTHFEDREAWAMGLALFDRRGYNWTIWSYKVTVTGWWTSSWGVYTCQMNADTAAEETKCNVSTCTYEEFIAACQLTRTENCAKGTLWEVLEEYNLK